MILYCRGSAWQFNLNSVPWNLNISFALLRTINRKFETFDGSKVNFFVADYFLLIFPLIKRIPMQEKMKVK
jgi:hypothetical protein